MEISEIWTGKVAVVTDANDSNDLCLVQELANAGIIVVVLARHKEWLDRTLVDEDWKIHVVECNISNTESVENAFKWINETYGKVNILINCIRIPYAEILASHNINLPGLVVCIREAYKLMGSHDEPGYIININIFAATKDAVTTFTNQVRFQLGNAEKPRIRVTSVSRDSSKSQLLAEQGVNPAEIDRRTQLTALAFINSVKYSLSLSLNEIIPQITILETLESVVD